jgi:hypothetical protein
MTRFSIKRLFLLSFLVLTTFTSQAHFTTKGPYGGSVTCLYASDTIIYVGTASGGVFRTTSAAATSWRYANYDGLTHPSINSITAIGNYVMAGTNGGVFKSNNAGNAWTASNTGLTNTTVLSLITAGDHVIAGTNGGGIFLSHDSGSTWEASNVGLTNLVITGFAYDGTTIYASTKGGVYSSVDEGDSWTVMNTGLVNLDLKSIAVSGNSIFVANSNGGIFVTPKSLTNWTPSGAGIDTSVNSLYAAGGIVYASTNLGVYQSPDQNIQWTAMNTGYTGPVNVSVLYNGKLFAGSKDDGIYRSTSLATGGWKEFNTGFNNLETYAIYNSGTLVMAATNKGLFVSNDLAANYVPSNNGLTDSLHITSLVFGGSKLYASTQYSGVFVSADTGITWTPANTGLSEPAILKLITTNTMIYAASASGEVYISPLTAINWSLTSGLPLKIFPTAFASDGSTHVFLGTATQGVFMCMDNLTWTNANSGLGNLNVSSLVVSGSILYAGTSGGIFKRELMGTWSAANTGLPTQQITSLATAGQWVAAGFKGGVYVTYDQASLWKAPNVMQYIPAYADITAISFTTLSTRIFVATPNNCLYSNGIAELPTGIRDLQLDPATVSVAPNPNNGQFVLQLDNLKASVESIRIYDITGKTVYESTGHMLSYSPEVSLANPAGIYFITIQTTQGALSKKIIVR